MDNKFIEKESLLHLSAKKIVSDYLKEKECNDYVFEEFKICENDKRGLFEKDDDYFKLMISDYNNNTISQERGKIVFVPDIFVIFYRFPIFYEIVYKNDISQKKKNKMELFFEDNHADIVIIKAEEILNHCTNEEFFLPNYQTKFELTKYARKKTLDTSVNNRSIFTRVHFSKHDDFQFPEPIINIDWRFSFIQNKLLHLFFDEYRNKPDQIYNMIFQIKGKEDISQFLASLEFIVEQIKKSNIELETIADKKECEEVSMFDFKNAFSL